MLTLLFHILALFGLLHGTAIVWPVRFTIISEPLIMDASSSELWLFHIDGITLFPKIFSIFDFVAR
jgi:hypothetical protein